MDFLIRSNVLTGYIEVIISDGEEVDFSVFNHCSSIFLPKSVNKVNGLQRGELEEILVDLENPYLTSEDGILYNKEKTVLLRYPSKRKTERFVIPDTCHRISVIVLPSAIYHVKFLAIRQWCCDCRKLQLPILRVFYIFHNCWLARCLHRCTIQSLFHCTRVTIVPHTASDNPKEYWILLLNPTRVGSSRDSSGYMVYDISC